MSLSVPPTPLFLPVPACSDGQKRGYGYRVSAVSGSAKQDRFLKVGREISQAHDLADACSAHVTQACQFAIVRDDAVGDQPLEAMR